MSEVCNECGRREREDCPLCFWPIHERQPNANGWRHHHPMAASREASKEDEAGG